jgi:hypothetical protein
MKTRDVHGREITGSRTSSRSTRGWARVVGATWVCAGLAISVPAGARVKAVPPSQESGPVEDTDEHRADGEPSTIRESPSAGAEGGDPNDGTREGEPGRGA